MYWVNAQEKAESYCFVLLRKSDADENLIEALVEMGDLFKKLNQDQEADSCWKEALTRSETIDLTKHPNAKAAVERIQ